MDKKQQTTDDSYGNKGLVTFIDNLFLDKMDKKLYCKLWSYIPARTNEFTDVLSFITGTYIPIVLSSHCKVTFSNPI
jgi:hypothetical protein